MAHPNPNSRTDAPPDSMRRSFFGVFRYSRRALDLVWTTSRGLTIALGTLTLLAGVLPAGMAYVGALIIDAVVAASQVYRDTGVAEFRPVFMLVALEALIVTALAFAQRGISLCQALLRALLGQRVNVMILEKALTLELAQFEDSEFYDKLTRARREASSRPLSLVNRTFGLGQNLVSLVSYGVLLVQFSPWAVLVLILAGLPSFIAETRFSDEAFSLFRWRSPDTRMQIYLETVLAREDNVKEVKLFGLGPVAAAALPRHLHPPLHARPLTGDPPRRLGFRAGPDRHRGPVRGLRLDRRGRRAEPHHAGPDDHVPDAVPPGTGGSVRDSQRDRRHVRGQPVPVHAVRVPGNTRAGAARDRGAQRAWPRSGRRHPLRRRHLYLPRRRATGPERHRPAHPARASRWRWSARTVPARPR